MNLNFPDHTVDLMCTCQDAGICQKRVDEVHLRVALSEEKWIDLYLHGKKAL